MTPSPGELLIIGFEGLRPPDELLARIAEGHVGGVILFARNLGAPAEVAALCDALGRATPTGAPPLVVSIDQEGGRVQRLKAPLTVWPPMVKLGERNDLVLSEAVGRALGEELRLFGINVDYAPVLDIHTNTENRVIGDRAFGHDATSAASHAIAFWRGLEAAGVRGCGKHFPGHGDTLQDSHDELPRIAAPLERLRSVELEPFRKAVRAGVPMLMTAHIVYDGVDERPATMSRAWITDVLRGELGFQGVVVSDDLDMKAVAGHFSVEEVVREALAAGVDSFLACRNPEIQRQAEEALARAARDPRFAPRVAESIARMRSFRATLSPIAPADPQALSRALPHAEHQALAARI